MDIRVIKKAIAWSLLGVTLLFLLTGFGIENSNIVTPLTLGFLGKAASFKWHEFLWIPFVILLAAHLVLNMILKKAS
ncbi:MAG TPA: hypothetical protein VGK13_02915 [Methanocellaceae archaeon]|jgi:hypothetical protein